MKLKDIVSQLANRINQPHVIEVYLRQVYAKGFVEGAKQSPLINAYEHAPMAFESVIIKANATFLYEGIGVGYKLPGKNTFLINGTRHLSYDKDFKVFWMPIPK